MVKIKIEVGRRLYFLIIGFVLFLAFVIGVWAVNSASPSLMGHSLDEIDGLEDYVKSIVNSSQGGVEIPEMCKLIHSTRYNFELKDRKFVDLPPKCFSVQGCEMILRIYSYGVDLKYQHSVRFMQQPSGVSSDQKVRLEEWSTSDSRTLYVNGPTGMSDNYAPLGVVSNAIISQSTSMQVLDDYVAKNPKETDSTKIVIKDDSAIDSLDF